jgi:ketosteroid isomerase-like protein
VIQMSGSLVYTVGLEQSTARINGGVAEPMTIRLTHLYGDPHGQWRLMQRHVLLPTPAQRPPPPNRA